MNSNWSVLTVYENQDAKQLAMSFCDELIARFWPRNSFELNWRDWPALEAEEQSKAATQELVEANIILVSTGAPGSISAPVRSWLELSLPLRQSREGLLVGLTTRKSGVVTREAASTEAYLRKLAHLRGLDFITEIPPSLPGREPESAESCRSRASQVTTVLDKILHHCPPPYRNI